ncbi:MAG TPA: glycoside hydrolase family 3 N-terminal domain-containing protein [Candidatus Woesebacteria bacterium]|nr:glycoside hydrolase family 3 N-terminal domain-containing protein [Candidatus Woesebacteria bacterium]
MPVPIDTDNAVPTFSPEQKIAQLLIISIRLTNEKTPVLNDNQTKSLSDIQPGFIVLYGSKLSMKTVKKTTLLISQVNTPIPIAITVDHEGGVVQRLSGEGFTKLRPWSELCQIDSEKRREIFQKSADEIKEAGIDLILGPVIDFSPNASTILQNRICSADEEILFKSTTEILDIYTKTGIMSTLKHFPGIADLDVDLHYNYASIPHNTEHIALFKKILNIYPNIAVMTSHAGLESTNIPCSLDPQCVDLLSAYPDVLFITDDINMISAYAEVPSQSLAELAKESILAHNTIILLGPDVSFDEVKQVIHELREEYKNNKQFETAVDNAFIKIHNWKQQHKFNQYHEG